MTYWDKDTIQLVQSLNDKLKIDHSKWHKDKGNKYKRSAELISAGLCHLIISCNEKETIEYIEESVMWLKEINVDQPCPSKNHLFKANFLYLRIYILFYVITIKRLMKRFIEVFHYGCKVRRITYLN